LEIEGALKLFNPNEARTRKELIDPALQRAGWDVNNSDQVGLEIPVDGTDPKAWATLKAKLDRVKENGSSYTVKLPPGISDYVLYRPNREIIAVVEAKRTSVDPRLAQAQAEFYVEQLEMQQSFRPFAFMTNGKDIYFLDTAGASKRPVTGFFSLSDLENLLFIQQNKQPLSQTLINTSLHCEIGLVERLDRPINLAETRPSDVCTPQAGRRERSEHVGESPEQVVDCWL